MFKDIQQGFAKFFTKERVIILVIFIVLSWALLYYSDSKSRLFDGMETGFGSSAQPVDSSSSIPTVSNKVDSVISSITPAGYNSKPVADPSHLLPVDNNSQWAALNPTTMTQGMPDLLQAGYNIGIDTIGQTLRNPNLQLRSDPLIQPAVVGPWNQSTIEPDIGRVPLEIGQGPK
jgi:hypothetical protein